MSQPPLTYDSYLRLDRLLALQQPRTPREDARTWAAERFFVVCHQTSELWVSQVLVDLADASWFAEQGDWAAAQVSAERASSLVLLLNRHLHELLHLPVDDFMRFRGGLEPASGAQSQQFNDLLRGPRHPLIRALADALAAALPRVASDAPHRPGTCAHDECATAAALDTLLGGVLSWRRQHVVGSPGTELEFAL